MERKFFKKNNFTKINFLLSGLLLLCLGVLFLILVRKGVLIVSFKQRDQHPASSVVESYSEAVEISAKNLNFDQLKEYFQDLANKKGARYAFEILKRFQPGPNIDLHLLGHAVGDILYKQEGLNGITDCNNDFRNACSHSIVIGLFYDKGNGALADIAAACRKAPGGSGAYTMCFHGLGHGVLSYEGYDMAKAAAMCQRTGTAEYNYQESTQCLSGTVMEIVDGGGHDHNQWAKERVKYLDPKHPTALCEKDYFPAQTKFLCYEYLTPYLFEAAGAQPGSPMPDDFKKAFTYCNAIPLMQNRNACFGSFGKEFVGLVQSRDIRQESLLKMSDSNLNQVYKWCLLANDKTGAGACVVDAVNNLYWGGENDFHLALRFCGQVTDDYNQKSCYYSLMQAAKYYIKDSNYRTTFCSEVPENYTADCKQRLGL